MARSWVGRFERGWSERGWSERAAVSLGLLSTMHKNILTFCRILECFYGVLMWYNKYVV